MEFYHQEDIAQQPQPQQKSAEGLRPQSTNAPIPSKRPTATATGGAKPAQQQQIHHHTDPSSIPLDRESANTSPSPDLQPERPQQFWSQEQPPQQQQQPAAPRVSQRPTATTQQQQQQPPVQRPRQQAPPLPLGHLAMLIQTQISQVQVLQQHSDQFGVLDEALFVDLSRQLQQGVEDNGSVLQRMLVAQGLAQPPQQPQQQQARLQQQQQQPQQQPQTAAPAQQPQARTIPQHLQSQQEGRQSPTDQEVAQVFPLRFSQSELRGGGGGFGGGPQQAYVRAKQATRGPNQQHQQPQQQQTAAGPRNSQFGGAFGGQQQQRQPPSGETILALVEFKRGRTKRYEAGAFITPGTYVICDGDRGLDCGLVVHCSARTADGTVTRSEHFEGVHIDMNKVKSDCGTIHRVADEGDVTALHGDIASMERYALKTCRERVAQMDLPMDVVDCEFQFDRKKVTFFFDSNDAIDFRELTKDLFKIFGTRIWLENINSKVKNVVPEGALSHADKQLYAERGLKAQRR